MRFNELYQIEEIEALNKFDFENQTISELYIGDLLSRVITQIDQHTLWLTVQAQMNALAVATLSECPVIIFTEGVNVSNDLIAKANENQIALFKTNLTGGRLAKLLVEKGL